MEYCGRLALMNTVWEAVIDFYFLHFTCVRGCTIKDSFAVGINYILNKLLHFEISDLHSDNFCFSKFISASEWQKVQRYMNSLALILTWSLCRGILSCISVSFSHTKTNAESFQSCCHTTPFSLFGLCCYSYCGQDRWKRTGILWQPRPI